MPDFANESNWVNLYDSIVVAQGVAGSPLTYLPIPPILLEQSANYPFLRVEADYEQARLWWRLGAWIDFLVDEDPPSVEAARILAPVNKPAIIAKPDYLAVYRIRATIPYYFEEISLKIDGYKETFEIRINCGGEDFTDLSGKLWQADTFRTRGGSYISPTPDIPNGVLYSSEAYDFAYSIPLENGNYIVSLFFVEIGSLPEIGERIFSVYINESLFLNNFSIVDEAVNTPVVKSLLVTISSGNLSINSVNVSGYPSKINAIEIKSV